MVSKNSKGGLNNNLNDGCNNDPKNPLVELFFSLPPKQFSLLSSIIGILLLDDLTLNQQNSLGNFLVNVGTNILTAAGQGQLQEDQNSQKNGVEKEIEELKKRIGLLEEKLKKH